MVTISEPKVYLSLIVIGTLLVVGTGVGIVMFRAGDDAAEVVNEEESRVVELEWNDPVMLLRDPNCVDPDNGQDIPEGAIGYEPSIAVDKAGTLYYTAHKDLRWGSPGGGPLSGVPTPPAPCIQGYSTTWDYYASWFMVSTDQGETWAAPSDWGPAGAGSQACIGDEGDIGIDENDVVYYIDTYLEDNNLHVWDGSGTYSRCQRQQSMAADDRPWISAQDDGIVHYLGNNGVTIPGPNGEAGRYWYYRSTNGGTTFSPGVALPGGWAHMASEIDGEHHYVIQEVNNGGDGGIKVWASDDMGASFADPVIIGPLAGTHPEGYPWVAAGNNGTVVATWQESPNGGRDPGVLHFAMSHDYGVNWTNWSITPFEAVFLYPNVAVGPNDEVAIAFYANEGNHSVGDEWHLYAGMVLDPEEGDQWTFERADPDWLHVSSQEEVDTDDLHPLHDFFEITIDPTDSSLNIAYQHNVGEHPFEPGEEQRYLYFVRGQPVDLDL